MKSLIKDISESRPTALAQLFILYSPLFLRRGGGGVNTNKWCPAPFGHETQRPILFSPPFDETAPGDTVGTWERKWEAGEEVDESVLTRDERRGEANAPKLDHWHRCGKRCRVGLEVWEGRRSRGQETERGRRVREIEALFIYFCYSYHFYSFGQNNSGIMSRQKLQLRLWSLHDIKYPFWYYLVLDFFMQQASSVLTCINYLSVKLVFSVSAGNLHSS